jgi:hypothetical protein
MMNGMKRKRPPFSIYPRPSDLAAATTIAEAEDLHISQVFIRGFRAYLKQREKRAARRRQLVSTR